jgi:hypothetical protein
MSTAEQARFDAIVAEVITWPRERRMALVKKLYERPKSLNEIAASWPAPRGLSGQQMSELINYQGPPLSDEDIERLRDEALMEKYG